MHTHTIDDQNFGVRNTVASITVIQLNIEMSVGQYNALAGRTNHECTHARTHTHKLKWLIGIYGTRMLTGKKTHKKSVKKNEIVI